MQGSEGGVQGSVGAVRRQVQCRVDAGAAGTHMPKALLDTYGRVAVKPQGRSKGWCASCTCTQLWKSTAPLLLLLLLLLQQLVLVP